MFIFYITLLLINFCYHSSGLPVKYNETENVPNELQFLARTCNNPFLATTIRDKSEYCKMNETKNLPDLECFMFYDINKQLCKVFNNSEFDLQQSYNSKIQYYQNVQILCDSAKAWKFVTIQEHSAFKVLEQVFKDPIHCMKLCGVGDLLSDDANYYCTYFNWGYDLMKSLKQPASQLSVSASTTNINAAENNATALSSTTTIHATEVKNETKGKLNTQLLPINNVESAAGQVASPEKSEHKHQTLIPNQISGHIPTIDKNNSGKTVEQSIVSPPVLSEKAGIKKDASETNLKKDEVNSKNQHETANELANDFSNGIENGDDEVEKEDYAQDGDAPDTDGINSELQPSDPQMDKHEESSNVKIESINGITVQKGSIYPSETFPEVDDHFFPFFLTAIIIVVLLYVLYHNKNKFTKVVLGLIFEGRQSGRRRNSRGPAYRRLDTLEHAMSAPAAAPPDKIIY